VFDDKPLKLVETPAAMQEAVAKLSQALVLGVDTESDGFHRYQEKVALIQISDMETDYIFDRIQLVDLSPLQSLFENPGIIKILHGADYDIVSLKRDFGFQINNLFDTMVAAQFIGMSRIGLADLIQNFFGIKLDKTLQRHDWSARPLMLEHLNYARGDTHFLPALREALIWKLERLGRLEMVEEECALLTRRQWQGRAREEADFMKIKGAKLLGEQQLKGLRALYRYREEQAELVDRPPFKVIPDEVLLQLATLLPTEVAQVSALFRKGSALARKHSEGLALAVVAGLEDSRPLPGRGPRELPAVAHGSSREAELLLAAFRTWRTRKIEEEAQPLVAVASNSLLKSLARLAPRSLDALGRVPEIRQWQVHAYGNELLAIVGEVVQVRQQEAAKRKRRRRKRAEPLSPAVNNPGGNGSSG
jgi:ribonuclease D